MLKNKTPIFLSLDFETTGSNPDKDSIIEVGAFLFTYNSEGELIELDKISQLVFTEHEIPPIVSAITGISNEDLVGQPKLSSVLPKLEGLIEKCDYIVGHNIFLI